ncbi:MAG: ABC transporter permease [Symbiobacteriaceae bacterium]|nr:ABC transporter permease [Symbiobacteriaceae bacterium]
MTFFRLGMTNAWRSLARSIFAIISMSIAAGFLTYSISLSRGYNQLYKASSRAILGGEIVVYARQFGGVIPSGDSLWQHTFLLESPGSDIAFFHPELLQGGYLSSGEEKAYFTSDGLAALRYALPGITQLYPRYQIPAVSVESYRRSTPLRGRDAAMDALQARHPRQLVGTGRWFVPEDEGEMVAVVSRMQDMPEGYSVPQIGDTIRVDVPRLIYVEGEPVYLAGDPITMRFTVIGLLDIGTRMINETQLYWQLSEIQIPLTTWYKVWEEIGGKEYQPEQITLGYNDLSYLEDATLNLRSFFPQHTFYSAPTHLLQAERRGLLEALSGDAAELVVYEEAQQAMPLDLRLPFTLLIFGNAALVVASNLLIMASERKKEISILKAVGATRPQVVTMVVSEGLVISLVGAAFGFIFFRVPASLTQLTNGVGWFAILRGTIFDALAVATLSFIFAACFSLMPGLRTANLSIMEVLRHE